MYFKQIEMVGFKSFPNKTKLKFEPGITAVVGPNGCGKSNISDAILWALGEQSPRSLRGSSMEDVIFSGTDRIDPISMAEVSLTLSNENRTLPIDYDEITITRRLFRSGESEYILNKTEVRLKDMMNLLMGTGIGTSSYSIIGQGKIDLILSSKPEERRYIFEEASGITRYKSKKKEALRKLENTENNLIRINDIITEVKRQINSIERHAKKAEKYKSDFEMMKGLELKFTVNELRNINASLEKNKKDLDDVCSKEGILRLELDEVTSLIQKYRQNLDNTIQNLTETQEKLRDITIFMDKGRHKIELNKERINDLNNIKKSAEKEIDSLNEKIRLQEEEIKNVKGHFDSILTTKGDKEKLLIEKEESIKHLSREIEERQKDIKNAKDRTVDLLAFQTRTKNELIKLGADLQNRKSRLRRLETEKANTENERKNIETTLKNVERELEICMAEVQKTRTVLNEFKDSLNSCERQREDIRKRIIDNENAFNSLKSKEEILKEMIEDFEGFDKCVKLVMEAAKKGKLDGVMGVVADMLEPENGYELALEVALDKKAQAIVVENRDMLERIFSYLGDEKRGHFIIYEDIKKLVRRGPKWALSSFVKIEPNYQPLLDYLLGDIYVVEAKGEAYIALNQHRGNAKFVTKDGFYIEKGYIRGGFIRNEATASIIGRTKRLVEIKKEKSRLMKDIEILKKEETGRKEALSSLKEKVASVESESKRKEINLANVLSKKESVESSLKKIKDEESVLKLEIDEINELTHEISLKGDELNKRLNESESEREKLEANISSSQDAIQNKTKEKNNMIFNVSEIKSEITFLANTEIQESKNLYREDKLLAELKTQYEDKVRTGEDCEARIAVLEREEKDFGEKIDEKGKEEISLRERLAKISEDKKAVSEDLRNKERVYHEKEKVLEDYRNQSRNLEIRVKENEFMVVNIRDRIREIYKLDIDEIMGMEIEEGQNWEEIKNRIEVLRIKLEKMGPVNLVAIEEYKELEERHSFLTQQQEDLLRAKESLQKAIIKINKTARKLFTDTFQKIQVEFKDYFRMLFGGGHAELLMLDESDILESGIEIVARPPGKKLQNLLLLSGGEKALTAIALLFAIFKVKPSPFCILDEVDAALDESNISRFTRILQEFLKTSQFIIITHNKRTMQMADILYGITMEEKGVSKIVSVKFAEEEKSTPKKEEVLI